MPVTGGEMPWYDPSEYSREEMASGEVFVQMGFGCLTCAALIVLAGFGLNGLKSWIYKIAVGDDKEKTLIEKTREKAKEKMKERIKEQIKAEQAASSTMGANDTLKIMNELKNQKSK